MVYDAAQNQVVLFGGYLSNTAPFRSNDTWVWNGTTWTLQSPAASPSARADHAMAYDAGHGQVVLFGGFTDDGSTLGDTWLWNGTTWTEQSLATNPSGRFFAAMAYDAVHNQVVMFGGQPSISGGALNDTWVWDGTTWTEQTPANSPPARYGHTMAFDAQRGQIVLFGGESASSNFLNDTWVWDGTNWTQESPAASPAGRAFHNAAYDAAQGQVVLFGGYYGTSIFNDTWGWESPGNFGSANVCPSGQSTPAPCSNTLALTYNFVASSTTLGTTQVLTQGTTGLDFTLGSGGTCTGTVSAGTCTVNVTFAPKAPGFRLGAVELTDSSGGVLATSLIYGTGQGPVAAFFTTSANPTTVNTGGVPLSGPKGVAVDAAGDIFIADTGNARVVKIPASGTPTTVGVGLEYPQGLAVDGAGDLFIADNNLNEVIEVPAGCTSSGCQIIVGSGLNSQLGVAVDGAGDVFFGSYGDHEVVEVPANGGPQTVVYSPVTGSGPTSNPVGLAVDGAGDLFIADFGLAKVVKIPAGCTSSACQTTVGSELYQPEGVAVDAAGDVFIADAVNYQVINDGVVWEVPAGCTNINCQNEALTGITSYNVAADAAGDIFIADIYNNRVDELKRSQPPSLIFPTATNVDSRDTTDGSMLVSLQNVGNATLSFPILSGNNPSIGPDFSLFSNGLGDCPLTTPSSSAPGTLAAAALCVYSVEFYPMTAGNPLSEFLTLTDNNLNATSPAATQAMSLRGVGLATAFTIGGSVSGLVGSGLVLQDNLADNLSIGSNGSFTFAGTFTTGTPYSVTVLSSPAGQSCTVTNGTGTVGSANVTNIQVNCVALVYYTLTVTEVGTGSGTVTDNHGQISCSGGTCTGSYLSGTLVALTANATGTSTFVGWGGACASAGAGASCNLTVNSALNVSASFVAPGTSQSGILKPITAGVVYGQGGSFTSNTDNNGGPSANSLADPTGSALDSNGNLYVGDTGNNRVLFYPAGSTTPTRVYGQGGSFITNSQNEGGITANSLNNPYGVALDSGGNLYICDLLNNRVLFYPAGSTTATRVYGQGGSFTSGTANNGGISANSLDQPYAVALDSSGNLYVAEIGNNRVLFYPAGSTTATQVYGQGGSFTTNTANNGGISANSLDEPLGLALDSSGDLYVADELNNRVLFYPAGSTTATRVYGQGGSFTTGIANNGGVSGNSLYQPFGVALDSSGDLYVGDTFNNRVLFYPFGSTTATRVYGQLGSFTSNSQNSGGVSANGLVSPEGVPLDSSGNLYVADYGNNRVVKYGSFGNVNFCPASQTTPAPCNRTIALNYYAAPNTTFGAIEVVTQGAPNLDYTLGSGSTCTGVSSAGGACTVNVNFAPLAPGLRTGEVQLFDNGGNLLASTPAYGIGQAPESAFGPGVETTVPASGLSYPVGVAVDGAGDVFIADYHASEVVKVAPGGVQTTVYSASGQGPIGVAVDGAGDLFIVNYYGGQLVKVTPGGVPTTLLSGLDNPVGVAVDGAGDVFVGNSGNHRVVEVTPSGVQTTVYSGGSNSQPFGVAVDGAGDVFIADQGLDQVVEVTPGGVQTTVPASGLATPYGVAVDAAGDVFVADSENRQVVEVTPSGVQTTVGSGLIYPSGVAVDGAGDVFIGDQSLSQVLEVNRSQPPSFSFALTSAGSTSVDSPQSVTIQNIGNQTLAVSLSPIPDANFLASSSSACLGGGFTLAPGAICSESFSFTPQSTGYLTDVAYFSDNTLNLAASVVAQAVNLSGVGDIAGQAATVIVPNVVGMAQAAATTAVAGAGLALGSVSSEYSSGEPAGSVIGENPAAGTQVAPGSAVKLLISIGEAPPPTPNPLTFENNYFVTGDYASAGVTLRGTGAHGMATGTITIPSSTATPSVSQGVPDGADIIDAFLYWQTLESTPAPSANIGTFLGYSITGQQIGSDLPNYTDPVSSLNGTLRAYRADVNAYFPIGANGVRFASGSFSVSLPDGGTALPLTEGASLVVIYRVLVAPNSTNPPSLPLKAVVIYDGSVVQTASTTQNMRGFYDSAGAGESTALYSAGGSWSNNSGSAALGAQSIQYTAPLNSGNAYVAEILSTPVINSDNDGILDAWKAGPGAGDFFAGQPGYYDVKTQSWVPLPGAKHGEKDLFVQFDWMCGNVLSNGSCDPTQENLYPSPDSNGNDPLAVVQQAFAATGIVLHLEIGNAVPESTCTDNLTTNPPQLCQFPGQPGVIGWKNSLEFSKLWPRNFASCASGGDCTARFPYGQKDSYHYVLFGHSLTIPAWNTRFGSLTGITVSGGTTTITTTGIPACPSRITISGVLGNAGLNGVYNTSGCTTTTMTVSTPGVTNWTYPNTLPEPVIGITSGTVTSISGYSDLGGADSAVTLALWETAPNQNMSKRANVIAGTLFHEIGHTLGLTHGGLYFGTPGSYIPTFDVNCKPNYQSSMNYLFQLDGVGPNAAVTYSNQQLDGEPQSGPPAILNDASLGSVYQLTDASGNPATYSTSAWYSPNPPSSTASAATLHCDGTPLNGDSGYRVDASITTSPGWTNGQNIAFDGVPYTTLAGYNDVNNIDLRQVGATGGEFASLAGVLSFGSSATPLNVAAGGNVTLGSGGTVALGSGGTVTVGANSNVTLGSSGTITPGGTVTLNNGGSVTLPSTGGSVTLPSTGGTITIPSTIPSGSGGLITLGSGGLITLGSGGTVTLGSGGTVTLGSGGTITSGGISVTIPSTGGTFNVSSGGLITLGSGGTIALGSGGNIALGSGGTIAMGSGGIVALGSGGNVTLGSGGIIALGSGGTIALGSGGNVTLGSGGTIALGSGGNVTLGSGGNVTLGSGGNVTLGSGGNVTLGSGGNVTLGSGGTVTLGSGGNVTLGSGGNVTLGSGGTIAMGSGGTVTLGSGGNVTLGSGGGQINGVTEPAGNYTVSSGGIIALGSGGTVALGSGGTVALGSGGTITMGSGGNVTLGSGGNVTLGSGGVVALGSGGTIALGSGGTIALGSGGNITLGSGGVTTTEMDYVTANSIVRPPPSATYTQQPPTQQTPASVTVNWMAPAFGVVQTYTISRSVGNGMPVVFGTPLVIGSVSGVGGNPPATTFTDTTPPTGTLVYTISTTLLPVAIDPTQRQSAPSPPAVLTINQNIVLGALPSSVTLPGPQTVTATAETTNGAANAQQVSFSATGPCSIGSQSPPDSNGVSSASVTLNSTGSCTITASQAGTSTYNAASPVSGTFMILPQGSNTTSQTITFPALQSVQYGGTFSVSASSSAGLSVSFTASGPCTVGPTTGTATGATNGVGVCKITASAAGNNTYSAASLTQTFTILPATLTVKANSFTISSGQSLPTLTSVISGFVNSDPTSVVGGAPALSTTATSASSPASYPITVATGTLTAANYSFLYVNGTLTIQLGNQAALVLKTTTPLTYNTSESLSTTGGSGTGAVSYAVTGGTGTCSITGASLTAASGTGTCLVTATKAADNDYNLITSTPANTVTLAPASQTITFTTNAPSSAAYNTSFTVAATGGASGNPVVFTNSGACSNIGGTYTITNSTGPCSVIANQAGNANYSMAPTVTQTVNATGPLVTVSPSNIAFGSVYLGSITTKSITVTNIGTAPATINQPLISIVQGGNSNEFVAVSLCPTSLAAGSHCTMTITFLAGPYYTPQTATLKIMDNAPGSPQPVTLSATVLIPQTITFTTNPPATAANHSSFTVAATGGASGNAVTFTSSGVCSNSGATYTMTSGTGTCSVIANQAGNSNYAAAAQVTKTLTATLGAQTITFTNNPPATAAYHSSFPVAATGGASGNAVTFTSSGVCSNSGATYTMTSGTGTCSVIANQAGNSSYAAAAQVTKTVTATLVAQTITFTNNPPATAAYHSSFPVAATGGASGNAVTFGSSGACSNSGATYTMTSGTGTCSVIANQAGNSNYAAAAQVTKTVTATLVAQTITFTTNPLATAAYHSSFKVAATGGASGNAVTFTSSGVCSNSGATYTMTSGTGTCSVIANQAGNSDYAAAAQVTKTVTATLVAQAITFTTSPPATAADHSSFTVAATGGASGNAVTFTSAGVCSNSGATYTMTSGTGTCSVIANQAGNSNYAAAAQVTKTVTAKQ
jgi:sugar lactone lactonase YvrE